MGDMSSTVDLEAVLKSLTLEEKISLLAGRNFWETVPIPGKVPNIKTTDGPNGARGGDFTGGTRAACFPAACSVASTFDKDLAQKIGMALSEEAQSKGARCLLGPTTCMHRHPLGGRNFESFSEDPFLAGSMASSVICGIQKDGAVAATIKHFAANEQETARMSVLETIGERALREIYLRPFEMAVRSPDPPLAVMTAYNCVNGTHCDSNEFLLKQVLRGDWGWKGLVMSDWGGTNSTAASLNAGLDLEMPGPTLRRGVDDVLAAIKAGEVTESTIDDRVRNVLHFLHRLRAFDDPTIPPEQAIDRPEHRALIREAGARGCVLLKNEGVLPLTPEKVRGKKIAVLGLAKIALAHGGGSASVNAHYKITPWDALQKALGDVAAELVYAPGAHTMRILPPLCCTDKTAVVGLDGKPGFTLQCYDRDTGALVSTTHGQPSCNLSPIGGGADETAWKVVEFVADLTPTESGPHYLGCTGLAATQVYINEELVYDQKDAAKDPMGFLFGAIAEDEFVYTLTANKTYRVRVRSNPPVNMPGLEMLNGRTGVRLGFMCGSEHDADLKAEAAALAASADYALVFTGHDPQWETEGQDQFGFHLPRDGSLDALVAAVGRANKNTVVINSTGVAVAMPWLEQVAAVLQAWFPGQEAGNSIVDVLTGAVNPEGRLPVSFPRRIEDAPAYGNFPGVVGPDDGVLRVEYAEGVFVGYRHYDRLNDKNILNFPFGHGLSYSTFEYGTMQVARDNNNNTFNVTLEVRNTGAVDGGTLVQVYVGRKGADTSRYPVKALVGFEKVRLRGGEGRTVKLGVSVRDCGFFDEERGKWVVPAGEYCFYLARSALDVVQTVGVVVEEEVSFAP